MLSKNTLHNFFILFHQKREVLQWQKIPAINQDPASISIKAP